MLLKDVIASLATHVLTENMTETHSLEKFKLQKPERKVNTCFF